MPNVTAATRGAHAVQRKQEEHHEVIAFGRIKRPRGAVLRVAMARPLPRRCLRRALPTLAQTPKSPVTINIVDVAGNLALTQDAIELYAKKNPNMVAKFNFTKAPSPELPGKLKAMQGAGRSDIDLVLTGTDFLAAGIEQGLLIKLLPGVRGEVPEPDGELPARGGEDAGARAGPGHRGGVHAGRPAARVQPGQGQAGADDAGRSCSRGARRIRTS